MRHTILLILLAPTLLWAQGNPNFEIGLQLDNDSFVSTYNDFYYTSGLLAFANYKSAKSSAEKIIVHSFTLKQQIYNPREVKSPFQEDHNRPYAGYFSAEYKNTKLYSSNSVLSWSFGLGIIGPDSKAEAFQNWMHRSFSFGDIIGWEQQIRNLPVVQLGCTYATPVFSKITSEKIDFHWYSQSEIGTAFVGVAAGTLGRISLLKQLTPMQNSNFYTGFGSAQKEFYFFVLPKINIQLYDATIQGSMFTDDSPVTFDLNPLRFKGEAGFKYKYHHYNLSAVFHYTTDEIRNSSSQGYYYGSLGFSYSF